MDGPSYARVGTAAADVAGHGFVNISVGGLGIFFQQDGCTHDLSGLAVAALRNVDFDPGALHRVGVVGGEALSGCDMLAFDAGQRRDTGADGATVEMDSAGAAECHAAAEFCPGQTKRIANDPQQRRGGIVIHGNRFSIQGEGSHEAPPGKESPTARNCRAGPDRCRDSFYWSLATDGRIHRKLKPGKEIWSPTRINRREIPHFAALRSE